MRRILIETGHPGQVHQFRNLAKVLESEGYEVLFAAKEKEMARHLLKAYGLKYQMLNKPVSGIIGKVIQLPGVYWQYALLLLRFRPNLILSRFSLQSAHLAWLFRIPHIGYTDTEHVKKLDAFTVPFVKYKLSADSYGRHLGKGHLRFKGNTELFYLHPNHFSPDPDVRRLLGLSDNEPYAVLRFVAWKAHHDLGRRGISEAMKEQLVATISRKMRVFISSEEELPPSLAPYRFSIAPERMHDALAFASLYVGEGGTMASEAALAGTPAIYVNPLTVGYVEEEARYGLVHSLRNDAQLIEKVRQILDDPESKANALQLSAGYIATLCDPTELFVRIIRSYPLSLTRPGMIPELIQTR